MRALHHGVETWDRPMDLKFGASLGVNMAVFC